MTDAPLSLEDFAPHRGELFPIESPDGAVDLVLIEAQPLSGSVRDGGGFRIEFEGPLEPELEQGVYNFHVDGLLREIFIVPIARTAEAMRYEAVFF